MSSSPQVLTESETCTRKGYYARAWQANKLSGKEMVTRALNLALRAREGPCWGDIAGDQVLQDAEDRGLETEASDVYSRVIHLAALSDILVSAIRKPSDSPWIAPPNVQGWTSACFMSPDGKYLRRLALASYWSDERHYSECRSWFTLGEQAHYNLPMQMAVLVIGQSKGGKYHGPWTQGFRHPLNKQLRFRRRRSGNQQDSQFNDKWEKIWREDHDEISRETWLQSMLTDDILRDVCFSVEIPVPAPEQCKRIRDMAKRKMERLERMIEKPEANLSSCDWPVPCVFRKLCHQIPEREPSEKQGFIRLIPREAAVQ